MTKEIKQVYSNWSAHPNCWVKDSDGDIIAQIPTAGNMTGKNMADSALSKSRLIAAAPELLEALEIAVKYLPDDDKATDVRIILSAIAKAKGE